MKQSRKSTVHRAIDSKILLTYEAVKKTDSKILLTDKEYTNHSMMHPKYIIV